MDADATTLSHVDPITQSMNHILHAQDIIQSFLYTLCVTFPQAQAVLSEDHDHINAR